MQRKAAAAAQARPAKGHKKAVKRKQNQTKLAKRKTRRG
jgi:hypothetical protein